MSTKQKPPRLLHHVISKNSWTTPYCTYAWLMAPYTPWSVPCLNWMRKLRPWHSWSPKLGTQPHVPAVDKHQGSLISILFTLLLLFFIVIVFFISIFYLFMTFSLACITLWTMWMYGGAASCILDYESWIASFLVSHFILGTLTLSKVCCTIYTPSIIFDSYPHIYLYHF